MQSVRSSLRTILDSPQLGCMIFLAASVGQNNPSYSSWLSIELDIFDIFLILSSHDIFTPSPPRGPTYCLDITPQALIMLSVYPANSVCPSALHAKLTHSGSRLFFPTAVYSGFNSSTLLFFSRSKMMMELDVAAHSQYRLGEKTRAWISSPAVSE